MQKLLAHGIELISVWRISLLSNMLFKGRKIVTCYTCTIVPTTSDQWTTPFPLTLFDGTEVFPVESTKHVGVVKTSITKTCLHGQNAANYFYRFLRQFSCGSVIFVHEIFSTTKVGTGGSDSEVRFAGDVTLPTKPLWSISSSSPLVWWGTSCSYPMKNNYFTLISVIVSDASFILTPLLRAFAAYGVLRNPDRMGSSSPLL